MNNTIRKNTDVRRNTATSDDSYSYTYSNDKYQQELV